MTSKKVPTRLSFIIDPDMEERLNNEQNKSHVINAALREYYKLRPLGGELQNFMNFINNFPDRKIETAKDLALLLHQYTETVRTMTMESRMLQNINDQLAPSVAIQSAKVGRVLDDGLGNIRQGTKG